MVRLIGGEITVRTKGLQAPSGAEGTGVEAGEAAGWGALHVRVQYKSDAAFPVSDSDLALPSLQAHMRYKSDATIIYGRRSPHMR